MHGELPGVLVAIVQLAGNRVPCHLEPLLLAVRHGRLDAAQTKLVAGVRVLRCIGGDHDRPDRRDALLGVPGRALGDIETEVDRPALHVCLEMMVAGGNGLGDAIDDLDDRDVHVPGLMRPGHGYHLCGVVLIAHLQLARQRDVDGLARVDPAGHVRVAHNLEVIRLGLLGTTGIRVGGDILTSGDAGHCIGRDSGRHGAGGRSGRLVRAIRSVAALRALRGTFRGGRGCPVRTSRSLGSLRSGSAFVCRCGLDPQRFRHRGSRNTSCCQRDRKTRGHRSMNVLPAHAYLPNNNVHEHHSSHDVRNDLYKPTVLMC